MIGQFEINEDVLKEHNLTEEQATNIAIGQMLNNKNHDIKWYAKRKVNDKNATEYKFDTELSKIKDKGVISHLREYGWVLAKWCL